MIYEYNAIRPNAYTDQYSVGAIPTAAQVADLLKTCVCAAQMRWSHSFVLQGNRWSGSSCSMRFALPLWHSGFGALRVNRGAMTIPAGGQLVFRDWQTQTSVYSTTFSTSGASYWPTNITQTGGGWATVQGILPPSYLPNHVVEVCAENQTFSGCYGLVFYAQPVITSVYNRYAAFLANGDQVPLIESTNNLNYPAPTGFALFRTLQKLVQMAYEMPIILGALPWCENLSGTQFSGTWSDEYVAQAFNRWLPGRRWSEAIGGGNPYLWVVTDSDPAYPIVFQIGGLRVDVRAESIYHATRNTGPVEWSNDLYVVPLRMAEALRESTSEMLHTWCRATKVKSLCAWIGGAPGV